MKSRNKKKAFRLFITRFPFTFRPFCLRVLLVAHNNWSWVLATAQAAAGGCPDAVTGRIDRGGKNQLGERRREEGGTRKMPKKGKWEKPDGGGGDVNETTEGWDHGDEQEAGVGVWVMERWFPPWGCPRIPQPQCPWGGARASPWSYMDDVGFRICSLMLPGVLWNIILL